MYYQELKAYLSAGELDGQIRVICGKEDVGEEKERYFKLLKAAYEEFGDGDYHFVSSPGRSEIGGNHTDHQHGRVVCASLTIDNLAIFKKRDDQRVIFRDNHFAPVEIDITDLSMREDEQNTSMALIRGIASRLKELGYVVGGFEALCDSRVLIGASISSSACFEVLIGEIFSCLYNEGGVLALDRALIGQYSENHYFGKPCGLLDQLAISQGGFTTIDFQDPGEPLIASYEFNFADYGYEFLIVNTKGDHSNLSAEYAAVPGEIKEVAHLLGVEYLRDSSYEELLAKLPQIREQVHNDRAILRSIHFFNEDLRAKQEKEAIERKDIKALLTLMVASGKSSFEYLQNVYPSSRPLSQSIALALALSETFLNGEGAYRIQGGGFEGTILAVVPFAKAADYKKMMMNVFGDDAILEVSIRPFGTKTLI